MIAELEVPRPSRRRRAQLRRRSPSSRSSPASTPASSAAAVITGELDAGCNGSAGHTIFPGARVWPPSCAESQPPRNARHPRGCRCSSHSHVDHQLGYHVATMGTEVVRRAAAARASRGRQGRAGHGESDRSGGQENNSALVGDEHSRRGSLLSGRGTFVPRRIGYMRIRPDMAGLAGDSTPENHCKAAIPLVGSAGPCGVRIPSPALSKLLPSLRFRR